MSDSRFSVSHDAPRAPMGAPFLEQQPTQLALEPGIEFGAIALFLRRRWMSVVLVTVLVVALVGAWTYTAPREYQSSATFLMEEKGQSGSAPAPGMLLLTSGGNSIENEIELLRSRRVVGEAVRELNLNVSTPGRSRADLLSEITVNADAEPASWKFERESNGTYTMRAEGPAGGHVASVTPGSLVQLPGTSFRLAGDLPDEFTVEIHDIGGTIAFVRGQIGAKQVGRESDLFELSCTGWSPRGAYRLCDAVGRAYLALRSELQRTEATQTREFLEDQVRLLGDRLRLAEDSLEQYSERSGVVALPERSNQEVSNAVDLRAQRDLLIAERASLSSFKSKIEARDGAGSYRELAYFPTFIDNRGVTDLISTLSDLENRRAELALTRTEQNADLAAVNDRIQEVENQLQSMVESYEIALETQIASLDDALATASANLSAIPAQQVELARRTRYASTLEETYRMLTMRLREAEIAEAVELPSVRVVDTASLPLSPSSPQPVVNLILGSMLGLSLGLTLAFFRDQVDRKIHAKKDVERETGLEVLTLIPHVSTAESVLPVRLEKARHEGMTPLASLPARRSWILPPDNADPVADRSESAPPEYEWTPALESFRSLATDIDFAVAKLAADTNPVIAVTSAQQGEGKTYTSSNLAVVSASFGRRTLLIDADMRSAGVSRFFGFAPDLPGLSDVLAGRIPAFRAWQTVSVLGSNALTVIPAGDVDSAMLHHGTQRGLHELIELSRTLFDLVIVDGPPLNLVSDSAVVAANVDAVLFVVRSGSSTPVAVKLSLERLRRATPHLLGVVLNDVGRHEHASPYSYYGYEGRRRRDT